MKHHQKTILVAGSSGTIAEALCKELKARKHNVWTLSRTANDSNQHLHFDLSQAESVPKLKQDLQDIGQSFDAVFHCSGILHDKDHQVERQLSDIQADWLMRSVEINLLSHIHLAQAMEDSINTEQAFKWLSLSAMVGSISDNGLGGWYSYRMTKAALNMFIKGLSIEWKRKNKKSCIYCFRINNA